MINGYKVMVLEVSGLIPISEARCHGESFRGTVLQAAGRTGGPTIAAEQLAFLLRIHDVLSSNRDLEAGYLG
jgi:hypothetical protein